jgi:hypothetical protein
MFMSKLIAFLICSMVCTSAISQTMYGLTYQLPVDDQYEKYETYRAFMVRFDDGTGFVRISFVRNGQDYLVHMNTTEEMTTLKAEKSNQQDTTYLLIQGDKPEFIRGNNPSVMKGFKVEAFGFFADAEGYFVPWKIFKGDLMDDNENVLVGDYDEDGLILLDDSDLTKDLVIEFFTEDEEIYQSRFVATTRPVSAPTSGATLRLIEKDKSRTVKNYRELAGFMQIGFKETVIAGADFGKTKVLEAINALKPTPQDIVVFYYTGHGFNYNNKPYQYPILALRQASYQPLNEHSLAMEEIYASLKSKGARLTLVMSDCCNSDPSAIAPTMPDVARTRSTGPVWDINNCRQLFFPEKPTAILMTAASKGELAAGNVSFGGFFSYNFKASMDRFLSQFNAIGRVSWEAIAEEAKKQTIAKANNTDCNIPNVGIKPCVQNPVFKIEIR